MRSVHEEIIRNETDAKFNIENGEENMGQHGYAYIKSVPFSDVINWLYGTDFNEFHGNLGDKFTVVEALYQDGTTKSLVWEDAVIRYANNHEEDEVVEANCTFEEVKEEILSGQITGIYYHSTVGWDNEDVYATFRKEASGSWCFAENVFTR